MFKTLPIVECDISSITMFKTLPIVECDICGFRRREDIQHGLFLALHVNAAANIRIVRPDERDSERDTHDYRHICACCVDAIRKG